MRNEVVGLCTRDAIVVVPGIMGSELVDMATGRTLWGLNDARWYLNAWTSGRSLKELTLTEDEQAGRYGRVRPTRLLRFTAYAPILQGFEPYTRLLQAVRRVAVHPDAVVEFPYDWRLPVAHNARRLAEYVDRHIAAWRRHPAQISAFRDDPTSGEPKIVIVAHSMGGLLARHMGLIPEAAQHLRATVTLGTPFYGSVKAIQLLGADTQGPGGLPRAKLRTLATGLPGVHDLLPRYRCVDTGTDARLLSAEDIAAIGGDKDLAVAAGTDFQHSSEISLVGHVQVIGAHQPTAQSVTIAGGLVSGRRYTCQPGPNGIRRIDLGGDGTVGRQSAQLPGVPAIPLALTHGAMARADEAILIVTDVLTRQMTGPWLGAAELGLDIPDIVTAAQEFRVTITGAEHPHDISGRVVSVQSERQVFALRPSLEGGEVRSKVAIGEAGLYRIEVTGGGGSRVSQVLMVEDAASVRGRRA
jgi:pimeloyl-ACP methyl ester carboxylesterase